MLDLTEKQAAVNATKRCARCTKFLPLDDFYPSQRSRKSPYCKRCSVAWQKERYRRLRDIPLDGSDLRLRQANEHPRWRGIEASYVTVHGRLATFRGPAAAHKCTHCPAQAAEWAYDHSAQDELYDERGCVYSTDLNCYFPLCSLCHKAYDKRHAGRT